MTNHAGSVLLACGDKPHAANKCRGQLGSVWYKHNDLGICTQIHRFPFCHVKFFMIVQNRIQTFENFVFSCSGNFKTHKYFGLLRCSRFHGSG